MKRPIFLYMCDGKWTLLQQWKVRGRISGRRAVSRRGSAEVENILSFSMWCSYWLFMASFIDPYIFVLGWKVQGLVQEWCEWRAHTFLTSILDWGDCCLQLVLEERATDSCWVGKLNFTVRKKHTASLRNIMAFLFWYRKIFVSVLVRLWRKWVFDAEVSVTRNMSHAVLCFKIYIWNWHSVKVVYEKLNIVHILCCCNMKDSLVYGSCIMKLLRSHWQLCVRLWTLMLWTLTYTCPNYI